MDNSNYILWQFQEIKNIDENTVLVHNSQLNKYLLKKTLPYSCFEIMEKIMNIHHPHLMEIYDVVDNGNSCTILTEYIFGNTIGYFVDSGMAFTEQQTTRIISQVCLGLSALHNNGIIHRDITASNVMIDVDGNAKIIDYDITRTIKPNSKKDTQILGTVGYSSPEQFGFTQTDERTDIYSVGVLMNIMLTGKMPNEFMYTGNLGNIITKCTKIDSEQRYSSAIELYYTLGNKKITDYSYSKVPGFRSNTTWKKAVAISCYILYGLVFIASIFGNSFKPNDIIMAIDITIIGSAIPYILFFDVFNLKRFIKSKKLTNKSKENILKIIAGVFVILCFAISGSLQ
jgi:serine/threonine protein kinase